jgi:phenylacetate-coenzyme A ligase PaaK-like adenylate-forming protein
MRERDAWTWFATLCEVGWQRAAGLGAVEQLAASRLDALVRYAREHSPLYRQAYRDVPEEHVRLADLPVMHKRVLMAGFDEWVTDPRIRRTGVERFLADRTHIGERYLDRYLVWKSSGSTGEPGVFVQDDDALAMYDALIAIQLARFDLAAGWLGGVVRGGRAALVAATGDHFASIASWQRVCRSAPGLAAVGLSIMEPLPQLVAELNDFAPAFLASYPTMLCALAGERAARRLKIDPALVWSGGEYLSPRAHRALERAFGCPVVNEYGASECLSIAFGCREGWLHVNADWVLVEPVDAAYRAAPPGQPSHTVLITNLANHVQPIIRYDLGDAVQAHPGRCTCGNPLPALRVQGRSDDVVVLPAAAGGEVSLIPLALTTVVEEAADIHRFQLVWFPPARLALRLDPADAGGHPAAAFRKAARALEAYAQRQGAVPVDIVLDPLPPQPDARSGKLRMVVAEQAQEARPGVRRSEGR